MLFPVSPPSRSVSYWISACPARAELPRLITAAILALEALTFEQRQSRNVCARSFSFSLVKKAPVSLVERRNDRLH